LPIGGITVDTLKDEIKKYNYVSGSIYRGDDGGIYIENISDGTYCASGTKNDLKIIKGDCEDLDYTPPTVKATINEITSTTATITVEAVDNQSGIYGYSYSIDDVNYTDISDKKMYKFIDLTPNQNNIVYIKVYNNKYEPNLDENDSKYESMIDSSVTKSSLAFITSIMDKPSFKISTSENSASTLKILDIMYPSKENGYKYTYIIGDNEEVEVNNQNVRLTINKNSIVSAKIYYQNEIIENSIEISGIDNEGPVANLKYNKNWEKTKKVEIEVIEEVTGLPEKPYSFDGGNTWQKDNYKKISKIENLKNKILVRDILGNITTKFTVNGEEKDPIIDYIDNELPTCELEVVSGTLGKNDWYTSDIEVGFKYVKDFYKYCENNECNIIEPGSGIKSSTIKDSLITEDTKSITVIGTVIDNVGLKNTCKIVLKRDANKPSFPKITASDNILSEQLHIAPFTLLFGGSKSLSGVTYQYSTDNKNYIDANEVFIDKNTNGTTYYVRACSGAGVCGDPATYIVKLDIKIPTVKSLEDSVYIKYKNNKAITSLFDISAPAGVEYNTTCYLITNNKRNKEVTNNNSLALGINLVECEAVATNGLKASARVTIKHEYDANVSCTIGTYTNGTCHISSNASICGTETKSSTTQVWDSCATTKNTCKYGCDSVYNACLTTTNTCQGAYYCTQGTLQSNQSKCALFASYTTKYTCSSGTLSGTKCKSTKSYYTTSQKCWSTCTSNGYSYESWSANSGAIGTCSCKKETSATATKTCPSGYTLNSSGTTCYKYISSSYNPCASGSATTCVAGYEQKNCSSCKTGSASECVGGYVSKTTTSTVAKSCDKKDYLKYLCNSKGTNTNNKNSISATLLGTICRF